MWIALNLSAEEQYTLHHTLIVDLIEGALPNYHALLKFQLTKGNRYDLAEIVCKTTRPAPPYGTNKTAPLQIIQEQHHQRVKVVQSSPGILTDYIYVIQHAGKSHHSYESYQGICKSMDPWQLYPEVLRGPPDLTSYISKLTEKGVLAKFIARLSSVASSAEASATVNILPEHVYVIYTGDESTDSLEQLTGLGAVTILPTLESDLGAGAEVKATVMGALTESLSHSLSDIFRTEPYFHLEEYDAGSQAEDQKSTKKFLEEVSYGKHDVGEPPALYGEAGTHHHLDSTPASSNVTLVTPRGKGPKPRRPTSVGAVPGAPIKVYHADYDCRAEPIDPLVDEHWQVNAERSINFNEE